MLKDVNGKSPKIALSAFVSKAAYVVGDVEIGENSNIWPGAVRVRAKITSHSLISSSGRFRSIFTHEVLDIVHYSCGFAHSDRPNPT